MCRGVQGVQAAVYAGRCKVCTSVKDLGGREEAETFITRFLQLSRACNYQRGCREGAGGAGGADCSLRRVAQSVH